MRIIKIRHNLAFCFLLLGMTPFQSFSQEPEDVEDLIVEEKVSQKERLGIGTYRIHVGFSTLKFQENDSYKRVYGKPSWMPTVRVDHYFWDWIATVGWSMQMGIYSDEGKTIQSENSGSDSEKVTMSMIPFQVSVNAMLAPFEQQWLSLNLWAGLEHVIFSEERPDSKDEDGSVLSSRETRNGILAGGSLNFRIDIFDQQSASSMRVINMRRIYLSPFFQSTRRSQSSDKAHFSRTEYGFMFSFETIN